MFLTAEKKGWTFRPPESLGSLGRSIQGGEMSGITEGYPVFCGQAVSTEQLELIGQLTARYRNLSRTELSATVCELLGWVRPNGKPKTVECRQFLQQLERKRPM